MTDAKCVLGRVWELECENDYLNTINCSLRAPPPGLRPPNGSSWLNFISYDESEMCVSAPSVSQRRTRPALTVPLSLVLLQEAGPLPADAQGEPLLLPLPELHRRDLWGNPSQDLPLPRALSHSGVL